MEIISDLQSTRSILPPLSTFQVLAAQVSDAISPRGPDSLGQHTANQSIATHELTLVSAVLHLRGITGNVVRQPLVDDAASHNALCWNGEVFGGLDVQSGTSDTEAVFHALLSRKSNESTMDIMKSIQGPFSFIYYETATGQLWFGRDILGRRSLLLGRHAIHGTLIVSNVRTSDDKIIWCELDTRGLYCVDLSKPNITVIQHYWPHISTTPSQRVVALATSSNADESKTMLMSDDENKTSVCDDEVAKDKKQEEEEEVIPLPQLPFYEHKDTYIMPDTFDESVAALTTVLSESVRVRVCDIAKPLSSTTARVAILFSGGIDCMILAALTSLHLPVHEPIDLVNVVFAGNCINSDMLSRAPDRATAVMGLQELEIAYPTRTWRLIEVDLRVEQLESEKSHILSLISPKDSIMDFNIGAVLMFGARASGIVVPSHRTVDVPALTAGVRYQDPNKKYNEYQDQPGSKRKLVTNDEEKATAPCQSSSSVILDEHHDVMTSNASVLLCGIGADEQLGGYGRHRTVFRKQGADGLRSELRKDCERLWERNLGRDDRVCADSGRESRHPFLDEHVMQCLTSLPLEHVCDLTEPPGKGDKKILRAMAMNLKLTKTATLQKRAMQFGSRIANRKVAGYVKMTSQVNVTDIVHPDFLDNAPPTNDYLNKKLNKKKHKPGFV